MSRKRILVVGAGPGGLCASMLLAHRGHQVLVFEKNAEVGGRNTPLRLGPYTFDTGPTFHLMPQVLDGAFERTGRKTADYLDMRRLDPLYRLQFPGKPDFFPCVERAEMRRRIEDAFPGDGPGFERYMKFEQDRTEHLVPCLGVPYDRWYHYLRLRLLKAIPYLDAHRTVHEVVSGYFQHAEMRLATTFQAKYLGMSPWACPGTFTFLSYMEHAWGIYHPIGGLWNISKAMAKVAQEEGAAIHLEQPVRKLLVDGRKVIGLELESGEKFGADAVVLNADFAYAMTHLVEPKHRRRYTDTNLAERPYSCSTFMLYLGLKTKYDIAHHNIIFANDYKKNVDDITDGRLPRDCSFYVQNPSVTDPTLAPEGHGTLYVLVPVPNNASRIDWNAQREPFAEHILDLIEQRTELTDLRSQIVEKRIITPADWEQKANIYQGAVFNLAHRITQMLYLRPHNRFEELDQCYLVGGGTHPGSGLPTILQSGIICADLIGAA